MSNLRLMDSEISDTFNTALRRFFTPWPWKPTHRR